MVPRPSVIASVYIQVLLLHHTDHMHFTHFDTPLYLIDCLFDYYAPRPRLPPNLFVVY